jgi:hypothetical protein
VTVIPKFQKWLKAGGLWLQVSLVKKKKSIKTPFQVKNKLGMVVGTCHSSYIEKPKKQGL